MKFNKILAYISVFYLSIWSMFIPDHMHAEVVHKLECKGLDNKYWTPYMAKGYARALVKEYGWNRSEYKALVKLWSTESHWRHNAFNYKPGNAEGEHAGGIPQILGLDPKTPAPLQIERGLAYIDHKYGKPSIAWAHHRSHNWY